MSRRNPDATSSRTAPERFFRKVKKTEGCWLWMARTNHAGYGTLKIESKSVLAHRYSYNLHYGQIPDGMFVCHHCDNPPCVNPAHLFAGTPSDNAIDRERKGRGFRPIGELANRGKLKEADVMQIIDLRRSGWSQGKLAVKFRVSKHSIYMITKGLSWSHLVTPEILISIQGARP